MNNYYYLLKATQGNNVGTIQSDSEEDALKQLNDIYAPNHPVTNEPHANIEIELISADAYEQEKRHIEAIRETEV